MTCLEFWNQNISRHEFFFSWQFQTLGCATYQAVDTILMLKCPWRKEIVEGSFQGIGKKPPGTGKISPWVLEWIDVPPNQLHYHLQPRQECIIPFFFPFWIEPRLDIRKPPKSPGSWGASGGYWFPFPELGSDWLLLAPREGTQIPTHRLKVATCLFKKYAEALFPLCISRKCQWSRLTCRH